MKNFTTTIVVILFALFTTNLIGQIRLDSLLITGEIYSKYIFTYDSEGRLKTYNEDDFGGSTIFYDEQNRVSQIKEYNPFLLDTVTIEDYIYSDEGLLLERKQTSDLGDGPIIDRSTYFYTDGILDEIHFSFGDESNYTVWQILAYTYYEDGKIKSINSSDPDGALGQGLTVFEYENDLVKYNHFYTSETNEYLSSVVFIYDGKNNLTSIKEGQLVNDEFIEGNTFSQYFYDNFSTMNETLHPFDFIEQREMSFMKWDIEPHFSAFNSDRIIQIKVLPDEYSDETNYDFFYSGITSTKTFEPVSKIQIFPNPTAESIYIDQSEIAKIVSIYDINGQQVLQIKDTNLVNVNSLISGTYTAIIETEKGNHFSTFVKK